MRIRIHASAEVEEESALAEHLERHIRLSLSRHEAAIRRVSAWLGRERGPAGERWIAFKVHLRGGRTLVREDRGREWSDLFGQGLGHVARDLGRRAALERADAFAETPASGSRPAAR